MDKPLGDFTMSLKEEDLGLVAEWTKFEKENPYYYFISDTIKQRITVLRDSLETQASTAEEMHRLQGELSGYRWVLGLPSVFQAEIDNIKEKTNG